MQKIANANKLIGGNPACHLWRVVQPEYPMKNKWTPTKRKIIEIIFFEVNVFIIGDAFIKFSLKVKL